MRKKREKRETRGVDTYELTDHVKDQQADLDAGFGCNPSNIYMYDPQPQHRIPEVGAWVMVVRALPLDAQQEER